MAEAPNTWAHCKPTNGMKFYSQRGFRNSWLEKAKKVPFGSRLKVSESYHGDGAHRGHANGDDVKYFLNINKEDHLIYYGPCDYCPPQLQCHFVTVISKYETLHHVPRHILHWEPVPFPCPMCCELDNPEKKVFRKDMLIKHIMRCHIDTELTQVLETAISSSECQMRNCHFRNRSADKMQGHFLKFHFNLSEKNILGALINHSGETRRNAERQFKDKIDELEATNDDLREKLKEFSKKTQEEEDKMKTKQTEKQEKIEELEDVVEALQSIDQMRITGIKELQAEREEAKRNHVILTQNLCQANSDLAKAMQDLQISEARGDDVAKEVDDLKEKNKRIENELKQLHLKIQAKDEADALMIEKIREEERAKAELKYMKLDIKFNLSKFQMKRQKGALKSCRNDSSLSKRQKTDQ